MQTLRLDMTKNRREYMYLRLKYHCNNLGYNVHIFHQIFGTNMNLRIIAANIEWDASAPRVTGLARGTGRVLLKLGQAVETETN